MRIGIVGVGEIGATIATRLGRAGHDVKVANSRGPETIDVGAFEGRVMAVDAADVGTEIDVLITSVPFGRIPDIAPLVQALPPETTIIDTSNYYPLRDGRVPSIEEGQVESAWVSEQLGRNVIKGWNAITSQSFANHSSAAGTTGRIAIPVAGDPGPGKDLAMTLVDQTGFDAFDAGGLADSWRQQTGTPAYCTDLTVDEMPSALQSADAARAPLRRDFVLAALMERYADGGPIDGDYLVRLNRAIYT